MLYNLNTRQQGWNNIVDLLRHELYSHELLILQLISVRREYSHGVLYKAATKGRYKMGKLPNNTINHKTYIHYASNENVGLYTEPTGVFKRNNIIAKTDVKKSRTIIESFCQFSKPKQSNFNQAFEVAVNGAPDDSRWCC